MAVEYKLRLSNGKLVLWPGSSGDEAVRSYTEAHQGMGLQVLAWRDLRAWRPYVPTRWAVS